MKQEYWRIILENTNCPHREAIDKKLGDEIYFCGKKKNPEDNPYCSYGNCIKKEI